MKLNLSEILTALSPAVRNSPLSSQGVNVPAEKTITHINDSSGFLLSSLNLFHKVPEPRRTLTRNLCATHTSSHKESPRRSWRSCDVDRWTLHLLCSLCHDFNTLTFTSNHYFVLFRYILLNNTRYGAIDYLGHVVFKVLFFSGLDPAQLKG